MPNPQDYTVGCICALSIESVALQAFLDETHDPPPDVSHDANSYTLGKIGSHNVVIAILPRGTYGLVSAATVARDLLHAFPNIRVGLMVGIGGGVRTSQHDVRLGDVVVSSPGNGKTGVIQYDYGKTIQNREFLQTGTLNKPPQAFLTTIAKLEASYELHGNRLDENITEVLRARPRLKRKYSPPPASTDRLYVSEFAHPDPEADCYKVCGDATSRLVKREARDHDAGEDKITVHYGLIASANTVMKDALVRDKLARDTGVLCFEMEAAGLMDHFPCLVVRGICDYADSHKNKAWQGYAAMAAAAYARDLLRHTSANRVGMEQRIVEILSHVQGNLEQVQQAAHAIKENTERAINQQNTLHLEKLSMALTREQQDCHQAFKVSGYESQKNINPDRIEGTCQWILKNGQYLEWQNSGHDDLLWVSADPGCGKSVLAKSLVDKDLKGCSASVCYFFFKDNDEQNSLAIALCAVLHQLFGMQPYLLCHALPEWRRSGTKIQQEVEELWRILIASISDTTFASAVCIFDALDECRPTDRVLLMRKLEAFYSHSRLSARKSWLKFLVTSRPYDDIHDGFRQTVQSFPHIHVRGEEENAQIQEEISLVVKHQMAELGMNLRLTPGTKERLEQQLLQMKHRTYLWLYLAIDDIREQLRSSLVAEKEPFTLIPNSVSAAYTKILSRVPADKVSDAKLILRIIIGARRPLSVEEMAIALSFAKSDSSRGSGKVQLKADGIDRKIRRLCGLFVFINNSRVYLIHQTAREFLLSTDHDWSLQQGDTEVLLSKICLEHLLLEDASCLEGFLSYSAEHWPEHVRELPLDAEHRLAAQIDQLCDVSSARFTLWYPTLWRSVMGGLPEADMSPICLAAFNGHRNALQRAIAGDKKRINAQDDIGSHALYWASLQGYIDIVQLLIDGGADTNALGKNGHYHSLHAVSITGNTEIAQLLLSNGADVNLQGTDMSPLHIASSQGHLELVRLLIDNGANVNAQDRLRRTPLPSALTNGHLGIAKLLLENGADVNARRGILDTPLQTAVKRSYLEMAQLLIDNGADMNTRDLYHNTPLQNALTHGYLEMVQLLIHNGANVNARGGYHTPLQTAAERSYLEMAQLLIDNGADVNAPGRYYDTPLQNASHEGHLKMVQLLIKNGANVNASGSRYGSALHVASGAGYLGIVRHLIDRGADIDAQNNRFPSPLQLASEHGHLEVVRLLIDRGADVNMRNGDFASALQIASENGHVETAQLLMSKGASVAAQGSL